MAVTIRDVAEAAGVSPMAVSKVLHGKGANVRVSEVTAEKVRAAARELKYQPNVLARSLRSRRTHNIGLIFTNFRRLAGGSQYFVQLLDGLTAAAFERDYSLTICPKLSNGTHNTFSDGRFDGIVWGKILSGGEMLAEMEQSPVPVVAIHVPPPSEQTRTSFVCCDNEMGLDLAVEHLVSLGHTRIGFAVDQENLDASETITRTDAFRKAMRQRSLPVSEEDVLCWHESAADFSTWWRAKPPHTALILKSEAMAGNLLSQALEAGVRVPDELSVVGFDSSPYCEATTPRMTAIRQPVEEMAQRAVELLVDRIEGRAEGGAHLVFPCGLDIRDSTSRPRS